ncbi:MAG TPA: guanitoxin biosynthesis pre-guanitoxin forming N-methyltransferase GntF [Gaiellaceae bacterium]|jgi:hypothetical protein
MTTNAFDRFDPVAYLDHYYSTIGEENDNLLTFFARAYSRLDEQTAMLELGGGPTVYQLISAAPRVGAIDFADYIPANLDQVRLWADEAPTAFDWSPFIRRTLEIEGVESTAHAVQARADLLRSRLRRFLHCDAFDAEPCGSASRASYGIVSVNFVPEAMTGSIVVWRQIMRNILSLLKPGGTLIMSVTTGADYWRCGEVVLPAVRIGAAQLESELAMLGLRVDSMTTIDAEVVDATDPEYCGYTGMAFVQARAGAVVSDGAIAAAA